MFEDVPADFLVDFGTAVRWSPSVGGPAVEGLMIFDTPDQEIGSGSTLSTEYQVTFVTAAWPGIKRDERLQIPAGTGPLYKLRTHPQRQGDGAMSTAHLSREA